VNNPEMVNGGLMIEPGFFLFCDYNDFDDAFLSI
jgi:hypothetical protein